MKKPKQNRNKKNKTIQNSPTSAGPLCKATSPSCTTVERSLSTVKAPSAIKFRCQSKGNMSSLGGSSGLVQEMLFFFVFLYVCVWFLFLAPWGKHHQGRWLFGSTFLVAKNLQKTTFWCSLGSFNVLALGEPKSRVAVE